MIGIIAGTGFYDLGFLGEATEKTVKTAYGEAYALSGRDFLFIPRHGRDRNTPAHMLNHKANISAFKQEGITEIVSLTSVGSMKKSMVPKSMIVPHDYIQLSGVPTFNDSRATHITPGLDEELRKKIIAAAQKLRIRVTPRGVYIQTVGPRLETRAEISMFKDYADVVGMTMASEATLAKELGLKYAAISLVDNYAHGIVETPLDFTQVIKASAEQREGLKRIVKELIEQGAEK
jgi:5'-methylthioadenosine phosphorylase